MTSTIAAGVVVERLELASDALLRWMSPVHSGRFTDAEREAYAIECAKRAGHLANHLLDLARAA